jgi:hypothetical protein
MLHTEVSSRHVLIDKDDNVRLIDFDKTCGVYAPSEPEDEMDKVKGRLGLQTPVSSDSEGSDGGASDRFNPWDEW